MTAAVTVPVVVAQAPAMAAISLSCLPSLEGTEGATATPGTDRGPCVRTPASRRHSPVGKRAAPGTRVTSVWPLPRARRLRVLVSARKSLPVLLARQERDTQRAPEASGGRQRRFPFFLIVPHVTEGLQRAKDRLNRR